jgi:ankyrin repeat protein
METMNTLLIVQAVVSLLLFAGANPSMQDNLGSNALLEAVSNNRIAVLEQLRAAGATLPLSRSDTELSSKLCSLVVADEAELLHRYIAAGANVNVGDYDKRTPLHIAAAEGKMNFVSETVIFC